MNRRIYIEQSLTVLPPGTVFPPITNISDSIDSIYEDTLFNLKPTTGVFNLKLPKTKKKFKKWLMSHRYPRDAVEAICQMVAFGKGEISYYELAYRIVKGWIFGS